ncbi:hypothetical protein HDU92_008017 [Lobulomyces angularis]|nr:hypothetical protein HDU92_008017 [Lobulomyces angularis]
MEEDEESLSKAYIEALLLQEENFDQHYEREEDDLLNNTDQDDFEYSKKPVKKLKKSIQKLKEIKPKTPKPLKVNLEGMNVGTFTNEEESLFLEGLELFGRNWKQLQSHIKTRDGPSIRSHAQKHFIKLYRDKIPLPQKVAETGTGYTLSGKELDPYSASSRKYLGLEKKTETTDTDNNTIVSSEVSTAKKRKKNSILNVILKENNSLPKPITEEKIEENFLTTICKPEDLSISDFISEDENSRNLLLNDLLNTEADLKIFSKSVQEEHDRLDTPSAFRNSRPKRAAAKKNSTLSFNEIAESSNPHTLIKLESYSSTSLPGSGSEGCQPFKIYFHPSSLAMMDLHSSLLDNEVIGFLAGDWNQFNQSILKYQTMKKYLTKKKNKNLALTIKSTFPCRALEAKEGNEKKVSTSLHTNVEMDPTSEVEVRAKIKELKLHVVGWYHSHPTFHPEPSIIDVENQKNYQQLFRNNNDSGKIEEPFIGAIVAPFDTRSPTSINQLNIFYMDANSITGFPKKMKYEVCNFKEVSTFGVHKLHFDEMKRITESCSNFKFKTNFKNFWNLNQNNETKLEKLLKNLKFRFLDQGKMPLFNNDISNESAISVEDKKAVKHEEVVVVVEDNMAIEEEFVKVFEVLSYFEKTLKCF